MKSLENETVARLTQCARFEGEERVLSYLLAGCLSVTRTRTGTSVARRFAFCVLVRPSSHLTSAARYNDD
jgi:hypothetical protein